MKRNHKYISALFVSLLLAVPAYSQKVAADRLDQRLEMFDERLDLTDEQEAEIRDIWAQHRAEMQSWMAENGDATREERRNYFRERADAVHAEVEAVLTPEQVERLNAFRSSRRQGVRGRQDGRRGRSECCMRDGSRGRMEMRGRRAVVA